jgi:hypothetical protein
MTHDLKIKYEFAQLHFNEKKEWELRKNDRDFKDGDSRFWNLGICTFGKLPTFLKAKKYLD